eukprot:scaffold119052_cov18-Tisochrysis_lutea.AAC.4
MVHVIINRRAFNVKPPGSRPARSACRWREGNESQSRARVQAMHKQPGGGCPHPDVHDTLPMDDKIRQAR